MALKLEDVIEWILMSSTEDNNNVYVEALTLNVMVLEGWFFGGN